MIKTFNPDFKNINRKKLTGQRIMHVLGFEITKLGEGLIKGQLILTDM